MADVATQTEDILINGERRQTRNGYTRSLFAKTLEFNLDRFPLLTTKKMFMKGILTHRENIQVSQLLD